MPDQVYVVSILALAMAFGLGVIAGYFARYKEEKTDAEWVHHNACATTRLKALNDFDEVVDNARSDFRKRTLDRPK